MALGKGSQIGGVFVRVGADTTDLIRGLAKSQASVKQFVKVAGSLFAAFKVAQAAYGAALLGMARSEMKVIDSQAKLSRALGGTVTGLRAVKWAAEDNGIDGLEGSLNRLNRRLGAVEIGAGPAVKTVKQLGLNLKELASMDVDSRLATIADSIRDSGVSSQQAARHLQNLGFEQRGVAELFMQGGDAIREARKDIEDYGLAVSQIDAARIEAANSAFDRLRLVSDGLRTQLAVRLAPSLLEIGQRFATIAKSIVDAITQVDEMSDAADGLGGNTSIVQFAKAATIALAQLADFAVKSIKSVNYAIKSLELIDSWAHLEIARNRMESGPGFFDRLMGRDSQNLIDAHGKALRRHSQASQDAQRAAEDLAQSGGKFEELVRNAWAQPLPEITVPASSRGGDISPAGGKDDGKLKKELDDYKNRLKALSEFLSTKEQLEVSATAQRMADLQGILDRGLIQEGQYRSMVLGVTEKHFDALAEIEEERGKEALARLSEMNELKLLSDREHSQRVLDQSEKNQMALTQLLVDSFMERMEMLNGMRDEGDISDAEHKQKMLEAEQKYQEELVLIAARGAQQRNDVAAKEAADRQAVVGKMLSNMASLMNSGNKKLFEIGKVAAIAEALVSARESVVHAYKFGNKVGGPALGAAFAATAAAATAAQIAAIKNTQFSGGGGTGAGYSKPTDALPQDPTGGGGRGNQIVTINVEGELLSKKTVRSLIDQINDAVGDGARIQVA